MAIELKKPTRRQLLVAGGVAGGGLLLGFAFAGPSRLTSAARAVATGDERLLTTWIKLSPDNTVTIYVPHSDMGQGIHTALPMMAAEEMEADWQLVRMEQAPAARAFANDGLARGYLAGDIAIPSALLGVTDFSMLKIAEFMNLQLTGGSTAVRFTGHYGMRVAGAAAKEMLTRAAARRWGVPQAEVVAELSHVHHRASGRSASFGELAAEAAELSPPRAPKLKARADYRIVGTAPARFDIPAKVDGSAQYGIDARVPGMLYAAILHAPVFGGRLESVDAAPALARRGVRQVVELPHAVAVVADSYWRAKQALAALEPRFSDAGLGAVTSETIFVEQEKILAAEKGDKDVETGDAPRALAAATRVLEATYRVPYLAHACMEPMNCTARVENGKAEIWTGTQDGLGTAARVAKLAGLGLDDVTVHPLYMGGGFGRRGTGSLDYVDEAVLIAMQVGAPVKLVWSREDDIRQDKYRPAIVSTFRAALDDKGLPVAWDNRYIGRNEPAEAAHIPYAVPHQSIRVVDRTFHVPFGPWRSVAHTQHTFFTESFTDELAHEAGQDPFAYRRALLQHQPRHLAVLERAAEMAGWGRPLPAGRARGIAIQQSFGSIAAEVAEISIDAEGRVRVHRVTAAVDCGEVIHPDTARQQVESAIIYGLTAALYGEIAIEGGAVAQSNFTDYEMLTLAETPAIEVHFIESGAALGGLGEPGTPPIAAAVANAVFALTGQRIRQLPLKNHKLSPAAGQFARAAD